MRYVTSLTFDNKVLSKRWPMCRDSPSLGTGIVYDTVLNKHEAFGSWSLIRESGVIGAGVDSFAQVGYAVCHTPKTAMLHRYVDSYECLSGEPCQSFDDEDACLMYESLIGGLSVCRPDCKSIAIELPEESIQLFGAAGSVVMRTSGVTYSLCTLYDLLVSMCRNGSIDILRYKRIRFFSTRLKTTSIIRLSGTVEAERFFNKMRLDITRRR